MYPISPFRYIAFLLYYKYIEYPPMIRVCVAIVTICIFVYLFLIINQLCTIYKENLMSMNLKRLRNRYKKDMIAIITTKEKLSPEEIMQRLGINADFKMNTLRMRSMNNLMIEMMEDVGGEREINKDNFQFLQQVVKLPDFFENEILHGSMAYKLKAFKSADQMDGKIKETVGVRFLFSRDKHLRLRARLHSLKSSTTNAFNPATEDPHMKMAKDLMVRYHDALKYRMEHGMPIPNLIQICRDPGIQKGMKVFCFKEIGILGIKEAAPYLLDCLKETGDDDIREEIIHAAGSLRYSAMDFEDYIMNMYYTASQLLKKRILTTLGETASGSEKVLKFTVNEARETTDPIMFMALLTALYNFGPKGRAAFAELQEELPEDKQIFFEHVKCPLLDSKHYA